MRLLPCLHLVANDCFRTEIRSYYQTHDMLSRLVVYQITILGMANSTATETRISTDVQTATFFSALAECYSRNSSIPLSYSLTFNKDNPETFWLPIVRAKQNGCMWANGNQLCNDAKSTGLLESYPEGYDCVVLRTGDQFADIDKCQRHNGFICNYNGSEKCPNNAECYQTNTSKIAVYRSDISWFEARNACRKKGYDLATFEGEDLQHVAASLHHILHTDGHFWIGLAKSVWRLQPYKEASKYLLNESFLYNWDDGEPAIGGDCVIMSTKSSCWRAVPCFSKHRFACQKTGSAYVLGLQNLVNNTTRKTTTASLAPHRKTNTAEHRSCSSSDPHAKSDCNQKSAFEPSMLSFYLLVVLNVLFIGFVITNIIRHLCSQTQMIKEGRQLYSRMGIPDPCNGQSGQNTIECMLEKQERESFTTPNSLATMQISRKEVAKSNHVTCV